MAIRIEHVDPTRVPSRFGRAYAAIATTSVAKFVSRHVNWKLDPLLLRLTRGRLATTLVFPTALLETRVRGPGHDDATRSSTSTTRIGSRSLPRMPGHHGIPPGTSTSEPIRT